jgi:hypothetical protein
MLTELLRSASPDMARRWLHALLRVPVDQREALVQAFEARVLAEFGGHAEARAQAAMDAAGDALRVHYPPEQREGYVEERIVEYARVQAEPAVRAARKESPAKRATRG